MQYDYDLNWLRAHFTPRELQSVQYGVEREGLRVTADGKLALTPHPAVFGDKLKNPYITTDFSESQLELITSVFGCSRWTFAAINGLADIVEDELPPTEFLWPCSMPCIIPPTADIPIARYGDADGGESEAYRRQLIKKYGGKKQLLTGVHLNISFPDMFFQRVRMHFCPENTMRAFKDAMYLKMARGYLYYRPLVIYLTGATPLVDPSFFETEALPEDFDRYNWLSVRNSSLGYKNLEHIFPDYDTVEGFCRSVEDVIARGVISAPKELYSQLRLKAKRPAQILDSLRKDGIAYLELRSLDINPFSHGGIDQIEIRFLHRLMLWLMLKCEDLPENWQQEALENEEIVSRNGLGPNLKIRINGESVRFKDWALATLSEIMEMNRILRVGYDECLTEMWARVLDSQKTLAGRWQQECADQGFIQTALIRAMVYKRVAARRDGILKGFEDYTEADQKRIKYEITAGIWQPEIPECFEK